MLPIVAYPALPFHKYPEPFLCLVGMSRHYTLDENTYLEFLHDNDEEMDLLSFIRTPNPIKVRIGERQRVEDEPKLLDTTVGRVVPLLPVAPARAESELEASGVGIQLVSEAVETVVEDVAPLQPRRQKKWSTAFVDTGEPSHPAKRLRDDHGTPVRGEVVPTLPFVTSSVFATPEYEGEYHTDSVARTNLQTVGPPQRFIISSDSSHHSGTNVAEAEVDSVVRSSIPMMTVATTVASTVDPATIVKEKFVESSLFGGGSSSAGGADHTLGGFSNLTGSDFIVSDDGRVCREMVDEFAPPKFFASIRGMEHDQLFTEFNVGAARQMSLSVEVRMRTEYNIKEKRRLKSVVDEQMELLKVREREIENFKAQLLLKEAEATEVIRLRIEASKLEAVKKSLQDEVQALREHNATLEKDKNDLDVKVADLAASVKVREHEVADLDVVVHELETSSARLQEKVTVYKDYMGQLERFQDEQMKFMNDKFDKLYTEFIEMALHLEEKFYPHLLTTITGRRWLLTHGMELAIVKCLNSPEYLSALRVAISKAIEKGMKNGLAARITQGKEGRVLIDVDAYNPSVKVDYISALQQLQNVNYSLLAGLKLNKNSSVETLMNILRLEETLAERLGFNESQPHVDQLMVPIHHSLDQTVIGATALSLALDVSSSRV
ncbi:hypothetical protein Tco_1161129 [Tanacetum coccineum]